MLQPYRLRQNTGMAAIVALSMVAGSIAASAQNAPQSGYDPNQPRPYDDNGDKSAASTDNQGQQGYNQDQPDYNRDQQNYRQQQQAYDRAQQTYGQDQQSYNSDQQGYNNNEQTHNRDQQGYNRDQYQYQQGYNADQPGQMPEPGPPADYREGQIPPPPPGYAPPRDYSAQLDIDARYAADAQRWAAKYCTKSHGDIAAGAVIGGVLGAILGGATGGRNSGDSAAVGAVLGAGAGAVVASSQNNETSPGCPPGYVARNGAPEYSYSYPGYAYAAPGWYRPWVFIGGGWAYQPYPYHTYYYHSYKEPYRGYDRGNHEGYRRRPEEYRH